MAKQSKTRLDEFREQLGNRKLEIDDHKVDELRKIASAFSISGNHGMNKEALVDAINKARKN